MFLNINVNHWNVTAFFCNFCGVCLLRHSLYWTWHVLCNEDSLPGRDINCSIHMSNLSRPNNSILEDEQNFSSKRPTNGQLSQTYSGPNK